MRIDMDSKEIHALRQGRHGGGQAHDHAPRVPGGQRLLHDGHDHLQHRHEEAKIKGVATQEGDGWLIGGSVKKMADNTINIQDGSKYTTCDHTDHPTSIWR